MIYCCSLKCLVTITLRRSFPKDINIHVVALKLFINISNLESVLICHNHLVKYVIICLILPRYWLFGWWGQNQTSAFYLWILQNCTQNCNQIWHTFYLACIDDIYHEEGWTKFCPVKLARMVFQQNLSRPYLPSTLYNLYGIFCFC